MMDPDYIYDAQGQSEKLRRLAFYHAAQATEINRVHRGTPEATNEASFHWGAAVDLVGLANLLDLLEKERLAQNKRQPLNRGKDLTDIS